MLYFNSNIYKQNIHNKNKAFFLIFELTFSGCEFAVDDVKGMLRWLNFHALAHQCWYYQPLRKNEILSSSETPSMKAHIFSPIKLSHNYDNGAMRNLKRIWKKCLRYAKTPVLRFLFFPDIYLPNIIYPIKVIVDFA